MARKHAFVHGKVQGVAFRMCAQEAAWRLDLHGWIRNLSCGQRVELVVSGDDQSVETFLKWCGDGPPLAKVEKVEVSDDAGDEELKPFAILEDA
tara:strand:- start:74 stop:355 length:282 start_codon:yes stop_codon:yes gene_type:complete